MNCSKDGLMQIGDLAAKVGVTPRTIRYYEELGIVEPKERTGGGFRLYSESQLRRLQIVQSLKELGFGLDRIREFFNLKNGAESGGGVARALVEHLVEQERHIDDRISQYTLMKERNKKAIEILNGCLCCTVKACERDCHHCEVYREHEDVPDLIECTIYES
jgi:DNA-binding transcriptional MerR regulator